MECEAAVVGEQGGEGDEVGPVAVPVLLQHVAGRREEEGGAAAVAGNARSAGVSWGGAANAVGANQTVPGAGGVQLLGLAQRERQRDGLKRLRCREAHERAVAPAASAAATTAAAAKQEVLLALLQRRATR